MTFPFDPPPPSARVVLPSSFALATAGVVRAERRPLRAPPVWFLCFCLFVYPVYSLLWCAGWIASGAPTVMALYPTVRQIGLGCGVAAGALLWRRRSRPPAARMCAAFALGVSATLLFRLAEYQEAAAHRVPQPGFFRFFTEATQPPSLAASAFSLEPTADLTWPNGERNRAFLLPQVRARLLAGRTCGDVTASEPLHGFTFLRLKKVYGAPRRAGSLLGLQLNRDRCLTWKGHPAVG